MTDNGVNSAEGPTIIKADAATKKFIFQYIAQASGIIGILLICILNHKPFLINNGRAAFAAFFFSIIVVL